MHKYWKKLILSLFLTSEFSCDTIKNKCKNFFVKNIKFVCQKLQILALYSERTFERGVQVSKKQIASAKLERDYGLYFSNLQRFCLVKLKNHDQADDLVQECFYILYERYMKDEDIKNVAGFLYKIADNLIKAQWRENQRAEKTVQIEDVADIIPARTDEYSDIDYDVLAEKLLQTLNENEKELYKLKYIDNKAIDEISAELCMNYQAVAKRLSRLRQKVKDLITEYFEGDDDS